MGTCGGLKQVYKDNACCGNPAKAVSVAPPCPYNFNKPSCAKANVQAPRDLSTGATGTRIPKMATLNKAQQQALPLSNVHYHLVQSTRVTCIQMRLTQRPSMLPLLEVDIAVFPPT